MKGVSLKNFFAAIFIVLNAISPRAATNSLDPWTVRLNAPLFPPLNQVTFGAQRFVAVGAGGTIIVSSDAVHWTQAISGTTNDLYAVVISDPDVFVAVGANQTIVASTDYGATWTKTFSDSTNILTGVAYGNGQYRAVGQSVELTSPDAFNWTVESLTNAATSVAFGNETFAKVQGVPRHYGPLFNSVKFLDGMFYAVGAIYDPGLDSPPSFTPEVEYSPDASTWTTISLTDVLFQNEGEITDISYGLNQFVAVGYAPVPYSSSAAPTGAPRLYLSTDGKNWQKLQWTRPNNPSFHSVAFGNNGVLPGDGVFVAVGEEMGQSSIFFSLDGTNWASAFADFKSMTDPLRNSPFPPIPDGASFTSITAGPGAIVTVGTNWIAASTNGADWITQSFPRVFKTVSFGDVPLFSDSAIFFAAGPNTIATSPNGIDWSISDFSGNIASSIIANGAILISTDSSILMSKDAQQWTVVYTNQNTYLSAGRLSAYGNNTFVAARRYISGFTFSSDILTSTNGVDWRNSFTLTNASVNNIVYGKGMFILSTDQNSFAPQCWASQDGVHWGVVPSLPPSQALAYGKGKFVALGAYGTLKISDDGLNWTDGVNPWRPMTPQNAQVRAASFALNSFFVVGDDGYIFQSSSIAPNLELFTQLNPSGPIILANGPPGSYRLESSSDFIHWNTVDTFNLSEESDTILSRATPVDEMQFFRVVQ